MSRASIADHIEQLQKGGADLAMVLFVLTLQNAGDNGVWDVSDRSGFLRAVTGKSDGKAAAELPAIREAVEELKVLGVFADHATVYRPIVVMPQHVLARSAEDNLEARRVDGHVPRVDAYEKGAA